MTSSTALLALQALFTVTVVYGHALGRYNNEETIFVSKSSLDGTTLHRITRSQLRSDTWAQITGENREGREISYFRAYENAFHRKNTGSWFDEEYVGGFTHKMRVCKVRHSEGHEMYLLTHHSCDRAAANAYEQFHFFVASRNLEEYPTQKIYYASCQTKRSRFVYTKISEAYVNCGGDNWINEGHFYATVPQGYACDYIQAPEGTTISYEYSEGMISAANLRCNPGYTIQGDSTLRCSASGRWSGRQTGCEPVNCGSPRPRDSRMRVVTPGPYRYNDWVEFECEPGYELFPPEAQANCQLSGEWFYQQAECRLIDCNYPGEPRYGTTIANEGYQLGATISYQCSRGYRLDGPRGAACTGRGQWEPAELPTCREVRCPRLAQPENGRHHGSDSRFALDHEVIFQCDSGYSLVGEQVLRCEYDDESQQGVWSDDMPTCTQIRCPPPADPEDGSMTGSDFSYGAQISFRCDPGYTLIGSDVATCLNNKQWDAEPPTCNAIRCRDPGTPEHATRRGDDFTYLSVVTFRCNVGYRRQGSDTIVCTESGKWSSKLPECEPVGCEEIAAPVSGSKEGDTYTYGSKISFSCVPGYQLIGSNVTECLSNGDWSEQQPVCEPCGYRFYKAEAGVGRCQECPERSYTTSEASTSRKHCICEQDTHGPAGGPCRAIKCAFPAAPEHGEVRECGTENNDICSFSCEPGYILEGSRTRTCTPQGWTGHLPVCVACPQGTYKRDEGSLSCTPCPQNTHIPAGTLGTGADSCQCLPGFQRDQYGDCEDIDECVVNNGGCEDECMNTPGSFTCKCSTGGYELSQDGRSCYQANTCSDLTETPENGYLTCKRYEKTNGATCWIRCNAGYFFVSGINDYVTCGPGTNFEWSHKVVNKTNTIASCTEEFFVDVMLPIRATYESQFSCDSLEFSEDMFFEKMRVQSFVSTLHQCIDPTNSAKFCDATNLSVSCADVPSENEEESKSVLTVGFDLILNNKEEGALHPSCKDTCQRQNLREILGNAVNLTKEIQGLLSDKSLGIETAAGGVVPVRNTGMERVRPQLLCNETGRVQTDKRLCVPCAKGTYLAHRTNETCTPCPVGTYQNEESATSCKPCLTGSTTLTHGTPSPHMCNVRVTEYTVNGNSTATTTTTPNSRDSNNNEDDDDSTDLDSFGIPF